MPRTPVTPSEFARLLDRLDAAEFVRFVADLWRARGREVRVEGRAVVVTDAGGTERHLLIDHAPRWLSWPWGDRTPVSEADAVVINRRVPARRRHDGEREVIDADRLRELALYGIDRERCRELFERHLEHPVTVERPERPRGAGDADPESDDDGAERVLAAAVVGVVLVAGVVAGLLAPGAGLPVVGGGAASGSVADGVAGASTGGDGSAAAGTGDGDGSGTPAIVAAERSTDDGSGKPGAYPPGLDAEGIVDANALADAHVRTLGERSYRLEVTHREFVNGVPTAVRRETVRVEGPTVYATEVTGQGTVRTDPYRVAAATAYADGTWRYVQADGGNGSDLRYRRESLDRNAGGPDRFATQVETYLRWFLSVERSSVRGTLHRDGRTYYWVVADGDPWPGVENATTEALITPAGFVARLYRAHDVPGTPRSVEVTITYADLGNTTVDPPVWFKSGRAAADEAGGTESGTDAGNGTRNGTGTRTDEPEGNEEDEASIRVHGNATDQGGRRGMRPPVNGDRPSGR